MSGRNRGDSIAEIAREKDEQHPERSLWDVKDFVFHDLRNKENRTFTPPTNPSYGSLTEAGNVQVGLGMEGPTNEVVKTQPREANLLDFVKPPGKQRRRKNLSKDSLGSLEEVDEAEGSGGDLGLAKLSVDTVEETITTPDGATTSDTRNKEGEKAGISGSPQSFLFPIPKASDLTDITESLTNIAPSSISSVRSVSSLDSESSKESAETTRSDPPEGDDLNIVRQDEIDLILRRHFHDLQPSRLITLDLDTLTAITSQFPEDANVRHYLEPLTVRAHPRNPAHFYVVGLFERYVGISPTAEISDYINMMAPVVRGEAGVEGIDKYINATLRITTSDGRMFEGFLKCVDRENNMVLHRVNEYKLPDHGSTLITPPTATFRSRYLGLVVLMGRDIVKIEQRIGPNYPPPAQDIAMDETSYPPVDVSSRGLSVNMWD